MDNGINVIGYAPILDEGKYLDGWIKNIRYFVDVVYALYDPRSTDNTLDVLQQNVEKYKDSNCPVHIWMQDPTLTDSYRGHKGPNKELSYRANVNKFLEEIVPMDGWSMWLAADERLNPHQLDLYNEFLFHAEYAGYDAIVFDFYECYPDINHYVNYLAIYGYLLHRKLVKRTPNYRYHLTPHSGYDGGQNWVKSNLQFFHFGHLKGDIYLNWWRHGNGLDVMGDIPEDKRWIPFKNPFKDWVLGELEDEL